jgi:hypothetical protein
MIPDYKSDLHTRRPDVDMSPEAVVGRLREVSQLWKLWQSLRHFKFVDGPINSSRTPLENPPDAASATP